MDFTKGDMLRIESPFFVIGTLWETKGDDKVCFFAPSIAGWMIGRKFKSVEKYMKRKQWTFMWME